VCWQVPLHTGVDNPRRMLELAEHSDSVVVGDAGVDRGRPDALVAEVVLDELEVDAGIEQVSGNRMPQAVASQVGRESCAIAIADEPRLDLALSERSASPREKGCVCSSLRHLEVGSEYVLGRRPKRMFAPCATLQALDDDSAANQIHVATLKEADLPHPEPVVVDQREEGAIARVIHAREERPQLGLREVARQALVGRRDGGQGREAEALDDVATARPIESVHSSSFRLKSRGQSQIPPSPSLVREHPLS